MLNDPSQMEPSDAGSTKCEGQTPNIDVRAALVKSQSAAKTRAVKSADCLGGDHTPHPGVDKRLRRELSAPCAGQGEDGMIMNMARRDDDDDYEGPRSFSAITPSRCTELLSTQSVGRVAWQGPRGPQILPVTYVYYDGSIVFRTSPNSVLSDLSSSTEVVFEIDEIDQRNHRGWSVVASGRAEAVDEIDQRNHRGWSVVASGRAEAVDEPQEANRLLTDAGVVPWAPGDRNVLIRITPQKVTGRTVSAR